MDQMLWAKPALEEGRISSKKVEKVSDVLQEGDIILVSPSATGYTLQQMPEVEGAILTQ